ncbi:outer membrane beta-barrel protein [Dysgonomonas macrotermitis]|uniref:Outer membrane receptor proteins, mostly Fe transport n=1 Tax=Dysgonomonas macrotermitis TaxID=1346286 RepID=A0A1M4YII6_9BACT|nr:outer membrane beta-barrel family protein [Dysgonomonas macrotermitis]SHF05428.1 Outer membrane receptor proteins, mostly Fe transport [Dysgonomonas macrotermitis]
MKTSYLKKVLFNLFLLCCTSSMIGQTITGKVIDTESSEPLAFANVILLNSVDSTFIAGSITDDNGSFSLKASNATENYLIRVQYVGYEALTLRVGSANLGILSLSPSQTTLKEVQITASAKTFRMENGGISADIQNSRLKDMGSLSDVLGQLPFILKDQDNYTVFGKGTPVFYINNRLVRNNIEIQKISSKDIKNVTIITSPGTEYDSSVNAVIKIETIRPVGEGISGDIFTYNRYNSKLSTLNNVSLNYRKENLDIFGSFGYADMSFPKDRIITNSILTNSSVTNIGTQSKEKDSFRHIIPQIGFNYMIDKNHSFGGKYEYYNQLNLSGKHNQYIEVLKNNLKENELHSDKCYDGSSKSHYVNVYYTGILSKWLSMKVDIDYKTASNENGTDINNLLENGTIEKVATSNTASSDLYAAKIVLTTPIWDGNLVYGAEISHTKNRQDSYVIENEGAPGIIPSSNDVNQNLIAGFLSFEKSFGQLSGDIGLRFENISSEYIQNGNKIQEQSKDYQNLFPSIRLSYKHDKFQTELSYRYTIRRPSYSDLRSGIVYLAPYSYFSGNPLLQPTYQQSLTFTLMWQKFTFMTVYSHYKDRFFEMIPQLYLENSILLKPVNFDKSQQLSISLNYSSTVGIWNPNIEIGMEKGFIKFGTPSLTYNEPIFKASLRNNLKIKEWQVGCDIHGRTRGNRGLEYLEKSSWNTNIYISKSFLKGNLSVNVTANDIFNTIDDKMSIANNNVNVYYDNSMYRRNVQLTVTYRFNTSKNRYKGNRASNELDRL